MLPPCDVPTLAEVFQVCQGENNTIDNYFPTWHYVNMATKICIDLSPDDMKVLTSLKKSMTATMGKVSHAAVIRAALRTAAAK